VGQFLPAFSVNYTPAITTLTIFWYIEVFYRRLRPHEANGYLTPEACTLAASGF